MEPATCEHCISAISHVGPHATRPNPEPADKYDLVVIGAGVAGLLSVIVGKSLGKKCLMIEKHYMGGDCLNVGCFPSKALIRCARAVHEVKDSARFGVILPPGEVKVDFPAIMKRMRSLRAGIAPHDGVDRYCRDFCEQILLGKATFGGPDHVLVEGVDKPIYFDKCMVATGASAAVVPVPGLKDVPHLTNGNFFNLEELPPRACLIGAGPIGIEMAQTLHRFGCQVTIFEVMPQLLPREDPDAAACVTEALLEDGVAVHYSVKIVGVALKREGSLVKAPFALYGVTVVLASGETTEFECEALLNATGRVPNVWGLGLDAAGVEWDTRCGVHIDDFAKTSAGFLECTIRSNTPVGTFTAAHRYSDFVRLQGELAKAGYSAPLPGKLAWGTHTQSRMKARISALEAWVNGAVQSPTVSNHPALHAFLGLRMLAVNL